MDNQKYLLQRVMGSFASGVTVVTSCASDKIPHGFTASAITSLSLEPRLLLACINGDSSTLPIIMQAGCFAVNILAASQQDLAQQFASRRLDRFAGTPWRPGPVTGSPLLEGVLAYAECKLEGTAVGGDHVILMGEIVGGDSREDEPLIYFRGRYGRYDAVVGSVIHPADIWEIW